MDVVSFFSGCGGLDLGFEQAGFRVVWANERDSSIRETYIRNHPHTLLSNTDIRQVDISDIPNADGFIGGPPCQSWSVAGKQRGLSDERGRLFQTYVDIIRRKKPFFFLIENVSGILNDRFRIAFNHFVGSLSVDYNVQWKLLNALNYGVPQSRERVFLVGFRRDLDVSYEFPNATYTSPVSLAMAIGDITDAPVFHTGERKVMCNVRRTNHDALAVDFGPYYTRANRRRGWGQPSFTIHATAENMPLHPSSPCMMYHGRGEWAFQESRRSEYRRLSVRECARIQTFPDGFEFVYSDIRKAYRMIGNAVPPRMAYVLAKSISSAMTGDDACQNFVSQESKVLSEACLLVGYYKNSHHHNMILHNLLYYVRSDGRKGSVSEGLSNEKPRFLLLHHGMERELYELTCERPFVAGSAFLSELGFRVSGESYLCFRLRDAYRRNFHERDVRSFPVWKGRERYSPYITTLIFSNK